MKSVILICALYLFSFSLEAQVGIGTTNPNAQLDISASNASSPTNTDGVLIPRVSNLTASGAMTANQDGMLVFYTGTGFSGKGFYYWDQSSTTWVPVTNSNDADWQEIGSTSPPDSNSDNIFTLGNVSIGTNTAPSAQLDIESTSTRTIELSNTNNSAATYGIRGTVTNNSTNNLDTARGISMTLNGTGNSRQTGITSNITSDSDGNIRGFSSTVSGDGNGLHIGFDNSLSGTGTNQRIGVRNLITFGTPSSGSNGHYGIWNSISTDGNGERVGTINNIGGSGSGDKYGTKTEINSSVGGTHYGLYSDVQKANSYAGYFIGKTSFGNTTTNRYILPAADGTAGQVMTTDGTGNVNWANVGSSSNYAVAKIIMSTNQSIINNKINFNTVVFDVNNNFSTTDTRFDVAEAGIYKITAQYTTLNEFISSSASPTEYGISIYVNGTKISSVRYDQIAPSNSTSIRLVRSITTLADLNNGDYIEIYGDNGTFVTVTSDPLLTSFEVERIR